jgi:transcriptional regulator with XRE-family HTH domain
MVAGGKHREIQRKFGERVRRLRKEQGFSQEGFADACGLHRTYMGSVERGETNPTLSSLATIATTLKISISRLVEGIDQASTRSGERAIK